jgi:hypothetical protein
MSGQLENWTYRQDRPAQPWHIFEVDDTSGTHGPRALCGILSASSLSSKISPEPPGNRSRSVLDANRNCRTVGNWTELMTNPCRGEWRPPTDTDWRRLCRDPPTRCHDSLAGRC